MDLPIRNRKIKISPLLQLWVHEFAENRQTLELHVKRRRSDGMLPASVELDSEGEPESARVGLSVTTAEDLALQILVACGRVNLKENATGLCFEGYLPKRSDRK